jgi:Beta-galactosidase/beta-glucuronidase
MFHFRVTSLIVLLTLMIGVFWWTWKVPKGLPLSSAQDMSSTQRWDQDLSGTWDKFSSIRQAWLIEEQHINGRKPKYSLNGGEQFELPSNQSFSVAARRFRIPAEWSARTMQFVASGVKGHAIVYLNGEDSVHKIGEFEGSGVPSIIEIPATAFNYGEDNVILIQLAASKAQTQSLFSLTWPSDGQITGQIRLQAVVGTVLTSPHIDTSWDNNNNAAVTVTTQLVHYNLSENGPWLVNGILSDGSAEVAQQSLLVKPDGTANQTVVLKFDIQDVHRWSKQDPFLYQLRLTVSNPKGDQDDLAMPVGLRSIALAEGIWQLNQETIEINGNVLSPEKEAQVRNAGEVESYIKSEQEKGVNLIYFLGVFPDELWLQAADQLGMGIWVEWPVGMVPASRLPDTTEFRNLVSDGSRHPSIWAWTIGKGLENSPETGAFVKEAEELLAPNLVFDLKLNDFTIPKFTSEHSVMIQGNVLKGSWGQVINEESDSLKPLFWPQERIASQVWAILMLFLSWMNLRTVSWRYKEITEKRPKRRLRQAWFWHGWAFLAREGTLAAVITSSFYHIPIDWGIWFLHLWPGLELIKYQSPWLIWAVLGLILMLLRVLQVGLVSTHLPDSPHPLGLVYWLERRYRWVILVALLWALVPFGIPIYIPLETYFVLNLVFLPLRVRDIHRIGGHYKPFLVLPGVLGVSITFWVISRWADWLFLWHNFI